MTTNEKALLLHEEWKGKLETTSKAKVASREDLALAYTPGVAEPCKVIAADPEAAYRYTIKSNAIAVVSDSDKPVSPCAFCRQYLVDFDPDIQVIMANAAGTDVVEMTASELLPMAFMGSGRDK